MTRARAAGGALIVVGLLVLAGPVVALVWMHRMYTTDVSVDFVGGPGLPVWLIVGFALLVSGVLLIWRAQARRS